MKRKCLFRSNRKKLDSLLVRNKTDGNVDNFNVGEHDRGSGMVCAETIKIYSFKEHGR